MTSSGGLPAGRRLEIGDIVSAKFPGHDPQGREQEGSRPAVVVGLPERLGTPRFAVLLLAPMTGDKRHRWAELAPALYPRYPAGTAGLRSDSICLIDQVRAMGAERVYRYHGSLSDEEYRPIREGLERIMGFRKEASEEAQHRDQEDGRNDG